MSPMTSDSGRPCVFAWTVMTRSRSRWSMRAGPTAGKTCATCPSGMLACRPSAPVTISGSDSRSATLVRDSGARGLPHDGRDLVAELRQFFRVGPLELQLDLFLIAEAAGGNRRGDAAKPG